MSVRIHHIETLVPPHCYPQDLAAQKMQQWLGDERQARLVRALYRHSAIERRYSVVTDFDGDGPDAFFGRSADGALVEPGTAERNRRFSEGSRQMSVELARRLLEGCPGLAPKDITHVITASCTGFYNPGPDYHIVQELGMASSVERYHLGFMGCYAAFPALKMAQQFCLANPDAVVLVMCLELCTLHLQLGAGEDTMLGNSLFADGAAAALVSARDLGGPRGKYRIERFHSALLPEGQADMAWSLGDRGFDLALSSYVPKIIGANIGDLVRVALEGTGLGKSDMGAWAVHPGGKSIVDRVREALELDRQDVAVSLDVLRNFGNMSSATILFVLKEMLSRPSGGQEHPVFSMAFGPGLTVETGLLVREKSVI